MRYIDIAVESQAAFDALIAAVEGAGVNNHPLAKQHRTGSLKYLPLALPERVEAFPQHFASPSFPDALVDVARAVEGVVVTVGDDNTDALNAARDVRVKAEKARVR